MRRRPSVSASAPEKTELASRGNAVAAPTMPAAAGSPVRSSTSHGMATEATPLPAPENTTLASRKTKGVLVTNPLSDETRRRGL